MDVCTDNNSYSGAFKSFARNTCNSPQDNANVKYKISVKDLYDSESSAVENQGLTAEDLRIVLSEFHIENFQETESSEDHKKRLRELDIPLKKQFAKSPTFPCPQKVNTPLGGVGSHNVESSSELQRCASFPTTVKLVSAMKGGREREGSLPRTKMQVKWAEDVYDPPATSMSHTLRNNKPKKSKKDDHKHKHKKKKKKPAREKQALPNRASVPETGSDGTHTWQETTNCGSSAMTGQLEKLQFSMAEAT